MGDIDALTGERDRIVSEFRGLEGRLETLEKEQAEMVGKTDEAAGDTKTLARLKIEAEQLTEAKRMLDRQIGQKKKRLAEVNHIISMQVQSDMA
jgi:hypothetical protein